MVLAPVSMDYVTDLLCRVIMEQRAGILHATGPEDMTYAQAALFLAENLGLDTKLIQPVPCRDMPGLSHVPRHAALGGVVDGDEVGPRGFEAVAASFFTNQRRDHNQL